MNDNKDDLRLNPKRLEFEDLWPEDDEETQRFREELEQVLDVDSAIVREKSGERFLPEPDDKAMLPKVPSVKVMTAYQDYFDMGAGRTLAELHRRYEKTAELYGKASVPTTSLPTLYAWKKKFDWDIQVRADELDLYEQRMEAKRESAKKVVERQTGYSKVMQSLGFNFLRSLIDENGNLTKEGLAMMTPSEARRFLLDGGKMEIDLYGGEAKLEEDDEISFE